MKNYPSFSLGALLLMGSLVLVMLPSCTSMLSAKFENDTLGALPDKTLPGSPTGDALSYATEIETQLEVVTSPSDDAQKSLEYTSVPASGDLSGHGSWLGFRAKSTNFAKPLTFVWTARKSFNSGGPDLYIDCSDGSGVVAARIRIQSNGDIILVDDIVNDTGTNLGNLPNNEQHTFMLTVELSNGVYNISVIKASGNFNLNGHALLTSNIAIYHNPANPSVSFKYGSFSASQQYVIDEVFINRKN